MAFSSHGGALLDGVAVLLPTCEALTDTAVPAPQAVSALTDYVAIVPPHAEAQTDYAVGDPVSRMADYTPAATLYLVVEHYSVHGGAVGAVIGTGQQNPTTVGTAITSTDRTTGADVGFSVASQEHVTGANVGMAVRTLTQGTGAPVGANVGTPQQNPTTVGAAIEGVSRRLDIEMSLVTEELESVEDEP